MALLKAFPRPDGTEGNYVRLVAVILPSFDREAGISRALLAFSVYRDEEAAKQEGCAPCQNLPVQVDPAFFSGMQLPASFSELARMVYEKKGSIPGLEDALDIIEDPAPAEAEGTV